MERSTNSPAWRRYSVGVEIGPDDEVHARVWAPRRKTVELVLYSGSSERSAVALQPDGNGFFAGEIPRAAAGDLYKFRLDGDASFPDPASRFQPDGPHGASQITGSRFGWTDEAWTGVALRDLVISEIHVGTFTPDGTFRAAIARLDLLADAGINAIEIMPLADFPGRFGWGYDGVCLYAPTRLYGTPDDFRALVDAAHAKGIGVILDVVYNHFGPDGNYLAEYSGNYAGKRPTEWGASHNFDGDGSRAVRDFVVDNAAYWVREFHLDGLRLDATQQIYDESRPHIIAEIAASARGAAGTRRIVLIAENERQDNRLFRSAADGGFDVDAAWNDDFHHSALVALTGRASAYYTGYTGSPQELISAAKYGYLFQGQFYGWQEDRRGTPGLHEDPSRFVNYIESHDQVANAMPSHRLDALASRARVRALTGLTLLLPQTPMLFQGQEFGATTPFWFFADHQGELGKLVQTGRAEFLSQFIAAATEDAVAAMPDPASPETFAASKVDWSERARHTEMLRLHRDLIALRKSDPVLATRPSFARRQFDAAVIGPTACVFRFFGDGGLDRLLIANLGAALHSGTIAEPLLAPPEGMRWRTIWSSEDIRYGGTSVPDLDLEGRGWRVEAETTTLLAPVAADGQTTHR